MKYQVMIECEAESLEDAISDFKARVSEIEKGGWREQRCAGGGQGKGFGVSIGLRPLSLEERVRLLDVRA